MRDHYFQHVAFEGLGSIETFLNKKGFDISKTLLQEGQVFPEIELRN